MIFQCYLNNMLIKSGIINLNTGRHPIQSTQIFPDFWQHKLINFIGMFPPHFYRIRY